MHPTINCIRPRGPHLNEPELLSTSTPVLMAFQLHPNQTATPKIISPRPFFHMKFLEMLMVDYQKKACSVKSGALSPLKKLAGKKGIRRELQCLVSTCLQGRLVLPTTPCPLDVRMSRQGQPACTL